MKIVFLFYGQSKRFGIKIKIEVTQIYLFIYLTICAKSLFYVITGAWL